MAANGCVRQHEVNEGCHCCDSIEEANTVTSATGEVLQIGDRLTCETEGVIYFVNCLLCNKKYVGRTKKEMVARFGGHKREVRDGNRTALGRHFRAEHGIVDLPNEKFRLTIVQKVHRNENIDEEKRKWIHILNTMAPNGINERLPRDFNAELLLGLLYGENE